MTALQMFFAVIVGFSLGLILGFGFTWVLIKLTKFILKELDKP